MPISYDQPENKAYTKIPGIKTGGAEKTAIQVTETSLQNVSGGEKFQVLIVDDEPINLQVVSNHLSLHNISFTTASSGIEAIERIASGNKPDLVLLDVMMPKMSGYEVCRILREEYQHSTLPIIMLTAKNRINDLIRGFQFGANDYLPSLF